MPAGDLFHEDVTVPVYPLVQSCEMDRSPSRLEAVVRQFDVGENPRYRPRDTNGLPGRETHCDAFCADVAAAMGCLLPFWWRWPGQAAPTELSANRSIEWLAGPGSGYGWSPTTLEQARVAACRGELAIAGWRNPKGSGHVAVVLPSPEAGELLIAQAGASCFYGRPLSAGFGAAAAAAGFFVHR